MIALAAAYCLAAALARWRGGARVPLPDFGALTATPAVLLLAAVVALSAAVLLRPFENVLVFQDPSVYLITGIHTSRTGNLEVEDRLYHSLSPATQRAFSFERTTGDRFTARFRLDGLHVDDAGDRTVPQFFPLTSSWIAVFHALFGVRGSLYAVPALAVLSVALLFGAAQRLFGPWAGGAAAALLLLNPAEIWWGRNHDSDIVYQCLLFGGILAWCRYDATRRLAAAAVAGAAFGAISLARGDALLVLAPLALFFAWQWLRGRDLRGVAIAAATAAPLIALAAVIALTFAWPYTQYQYHAFGDGLRPWVLATGLCGIVVSAVVIWRRRAIAQALHDRDLTPVRGWIAGGFIALAVFAYFVRPLFAPSLSIPAEAAAAAATDESLVRFGWYVTLPGLAAAVAGVASMIVSRRHRAVTLLVLLTLTPALFYLQDPRVSADHIWASRRFVAAAMPLTAIAAGLVLAEASGLGHWRSRTDAQRYAGAGLAAAIAIATVVLTLPNTLPILQHTEQDGTPAQVRRITEVVPERDAVVVFSPSFGSGLIAPPLKLVHGRDAYISLFDTPPEAREELLRAALDAGRPAYFVFAADGLAPPGEPPAPESLDLGSFKLRKAGEYVIDTPILELRFDAIPRDGLRLQFRGVVYRVHDPRE